MSTYSLTLRLQKGSALTYQELDDNFVYLEGLSGSAGQSGSSGTSGFNGSSGTSGQAGSSGTSGLSGSSGTSGDSGSSGTSGQDGSSGTSGLSGSSGTSGDSGSSGTSGVAGSSGTSGSDGSNGTSGSSGQTGSSGTSGVSGSGGVSLPFGFTAGGFYTHTERFFPTTANFTATTMDDMAFTAFIPPVTFTIDGIATFMGQNTITNPRTTVETAIYDAKTYSVPTVSPPFVSYYPKNRITGATFTFATFSNASAGVYVTTIPDTQLIAGQIYFIGSYATMATPAANLTLGTLQPNPFTLHGVSLILTTGIANVNQISSGFFYSGTASATYPITGATFALPSTMPDNLLSAFNGVFGNMRYHPLRIKSIP